MVEREEKEAERERRGLAHTEKESHTLSRMSMVNTKLLTAHPLSRFCSSFTSFPMSLCACVPTLHWGSLDGVAGSSSSLAKWELEGAGFSLL